MYGVAPTGFVGRGDRSTRHPAGRSLLGLHHGPRWPQQGNSYAARSGRQVDLPGQGWGIACKSTSKPRPVRGPHPVGPRSVLDAYGIAGAKKDRASERVARRSRREPVSVDLAGARIFLSACLGSRHADGSKRIRGGADGGRHREFLVRARTRPHSVRAGRRKEGTENLQSHREGQACSQHSKSGKRNRTGRAPDGSSASRDPYVPRVANSGESRNGGVDIAPRSSSDGARARRPRRCYYVSLAREPIGEKEVPRVGAARSCATVDQTRRHAFPGRNEEQSGVAIGDVAYPRTFMISVLFPIGVTHAEAYATTR